VAATENGTRTDFVLDTAASNEFVLQEMSGEETTTYTYGSGLLSRETSTGIHYLLTDALGSVRLETDQTGDVVTDRTYDAFGIELGNPTMDGNRFRFTGQWTEGSGLTFLRARFYDPQTGAFLSIDPQPTASSPYAYCGNHPLSATDLSGENWLFDFLFGSGTPQQQSAAASVWTSPRQWLGSLGWSLQVWKHPKLSAVSFGIGAAVGAAGYCGLELLGAGAAEGSGSFFDGTFYSARVLSQMERGAGEFHSFPESVRAFESAGRVSSIRGGDGIVRHMLEIPGSYPKLGSPAIGGGEWVDGVFTFIKEASGQITHRFFMPSL